MSNDGKETPRTLLPSASKYGKVRQFAYIAERHLSGHCIPFFECQHFSPLRTIAVKYGRVCGVYGICLRH